MPTVERFDVMKHGPAGKSVFAAWGTRDDDGRLFLTADLPTQHEIHSAVDDLIQDLAGIPMRAKPLFVESNQR